MIVDGNTNYLGCRCTSECEFPCWQQYGLVREPVCTCGCGPFEFKPAVLLLRKGEPIPDGYQVQDVVH